MSKGIPKRLGEVYVFLLTRYAHFVTAICTLRVRDMHLWCVNRQWKEFLCLGYFLKGFRFLIVSF